MQIENFITVLRNRLLTENFDDDKINAITSIIKDSLRGYLISKDLRNEYEKNYRVRYKLFDTEKNIWVPCVAIKCAKGAALARAMVLNEIPGCRITSVWLIPNYVDSRF